MPFRRCAVAPWMPVLALVASLASAPAVAQQGPVARPAPASPGPILPPDRLAEKETERATRRLELEATQRLLQTTSEVKSKLEAEVNGLRADRARLNTALVDTTARLRATEGRITAIEQRLVTLAQTEEAIRRSLSARRNVIVEVLAALQRLGRSPPPAVLVRPEDMLEAVRASMLLGECLRLLPQFGEHGAEQHRGPHRLQHVLRAHQDGGRRCGPRCCSAPCSPNCGRRRRHSPATSPNS